MLTCYGGSCSVQMRKIRELKRMQNLPYSQEEIGLPGLRLILTGVIIKQIEIAAAWEVRNLINVIRACEEMRAN